MKNWLKITLGVIGFFMIAGIINSLVNTHNFQENANLIQEQYSASENDDQDLVNSVDDSKSKGWIEVISFKGKGNQDTESFYIVGNKLKITATTCCGFANEYGSSGTYSAIHLESELRGYLGPGLSIMTEGVEEGHGETIYRNLEEGEYYLSVITGVNWEVKVEEYS